jgi:VWFA-related protein
MAPHVRIPGLVLIAVSLSLSLSAQQAPDPAPPVINESIDVRVMNMETVVTDAQGKRVKGLTAADFRLLVDGREVPIDYFTEVADGASAASAPAQPAPAAPLEPAAPAAPAPMLGAAGRSVLVFIDLELSLKTQLRQVLRGLEKQLDRLGTEDRVAVVAFGQGKLTVLSDWTGDRKAVRAALTKASGLSSGGLASVRADRNSLRQDDELKRVVEQVSEGAAPASLAPPSQAWHSLDLVHKTMAASAAALRGFAAAPGRKTALLLSGGWPVDEPAVFLNLVDTANRLGYTLYPVDVAGIDTEALPDDIGDQSRFEPGMARTDFVASDWERATHDTFDSLARWTGGRALLNGDRMEALGSLVADTNSYYWLGFTPRWHGDGRRHRVNLEVRRPGLRARTRRDFTDMPRATESSQTLAARLALGRETGAPRLAVTLGPSKRAGSGVVDVPMIVGVPIEALAFTPKEGGYEAVLNAQVTLLDAQRNTQETHPLALRVAVKEMPPAGAMARFQATVRMRREERRLRVSLPDPLHDAILWGEGAVAK